MRSAENPLPVNIYCLGISHQTAPVTIRENFAFSEQQIEALLARIGCGGESIHGAIQELVILSTCNRVELYAAARYPVYEELARLLTEPRRLDESMYEPYFSRVENQEAITHLFRVAAGLDSLVLGEPQILGQVTEAYSLARRHGTAGSLLSRLFQAAIHAGKRSRTETRISHNPASIASVSVNLLQNRIRDLSSARILVIGAGEMAELTVESLLKRSHPQITVANRTLERAQTLAARWNGLAVSLEAIPELLPEVDAVITSTGAPHTIIHPDTVKNARSNNQHQPLVFMDIAVPRDVDPQVNELPGVEVFDLDHLSSGLEDSLSQRQAEVPAVEQILQEEIDRLLEYLKSLDVLPLIKQLRRQAQHIRRAELEKTLRKLPNLSPEEKERIELMTEAIIKKLLHSPTIWLQESARSTCTAEYAGFVRALFGLETTK